MIPEPNLPEYRRLGMPTIQDRATQALAPNKYLESAGTQAVVVAITAATADCLMSSLLHGCRRK